MESGMIPAMVPWSPNVDFGQAGNEHRVGRRPVIGVSEVEPCIGIWRLEVPFFHRDDDVVSGVALRGSVGNGSEGAEAVGGCDVAVSCRYACRPSRPGTERVGDDGRFQSLAPAG